MNNKISIGDYVIFCKGDIYTPTGDCYLVIDVKELSDKQQYALIQNKNDTKWVNIDDLFVVSRKCDSNYFIARLY